MLIIKTPQQYSWLLHTVGIGVTGIRVPFVDLMGIPQFDCSSCRKTFFLWDEGKKWNRGVDVFYIQGIWICKKCRREEVLKKIGFIV